MGLLGIFINGFAGSLFELTALTEFAIIFFNVNSMLENYKL